MSDDRLRAAAEAAGLILEWRDWRDRPHTVSPDTLRAVLDAMGLSADADGPPDKEQGFRTVDVGDTLRLGEGRGKVRFEDGRAHDVDLAGFAIDVSGYHRVEMRDGEIAVAAAPRRAPGVEDVTGRPRAWGTAVQLYSVRGPNASGLGDFAALADLARHAGAAGAAALAISPAHALFTASPDRYSPYAPSSRDFLNPLYADPALAGAHGCEANGGSLVDWPSAATARLTRLRDAFERFDGEAAFDRFVADGGDPLRGHALFEAIDGHAGGGGWTAWPEALRDPGGHDVAAFEREHEREVRFHLWLQWIAERSLQAAQRAAIDAGMRIGLLADLAVGLDPGGSHAWSRRGELIAGLTIGAPPDEFQQKGQGWGITGFSPVALARRGFEPWLRTLRAALRHAGGVRIDHALGLRRLWVIPEGAEPLDGCYLRYPFDDLLRLLALEAQRAGAIVVGEDLGTVPPGLRDALAERHLLGMSILSFERDHDGGFVDPARWRPVAAAMTTTHDLTPIAGWWTGVDIEWRDRLGTPGDDEEARAADRAKLWRRAVADHVASGDVPAADDPAPAVDAAIALVSRSACELAIVPAEDLFGLDQAPNLPGTTNEHPNWRRRLPAEGATLFAEPAVRRRTAFLAEDRP